MIKEKQKLVGNLSTKGSLSGSLSNSVIYVDPIIQEKEVTPTRNVQEITPDTGYTGLSKVTVKGYVPKVANKTITSNGVYSAEEEGLDGYDIVKVETGKYAPRYVSFQQYSGTELDYELSNLDIKNMTSTSSMFNNCKALKQLNLRNFIKSNIKNISSMFSNCNALETIDISGWDTSNVTNIAYLFNNCNFLNIDISGLKFGELTNIDSLFGGCNRIRGEIVLPNMNISKCTSLVNTFYNIGASKIKGLENWDTSNITDMMQTFCSARSLAELDISKWNCSKVTTMYQMFSGCYVLTNLSEIDASNTPHIASMFTACYELTNFGGLKNLGQGYSTNESANYYKYKLNLSASNKLTEQSIIKVLNNLYDIKTKGCKPQTVAIGATNLAKLTSEEGQQALSNAQSKGWTVS